MKTRWPLPLLLVAGCTTKAPPPVSAPIGNRAAGWTLLAPAGTDGPESFVADVAPVGDGLWLATLEVSDAGTGAIGRVMRLDADGPAIETARIDDSIARLVPQPDGLAAVTIVRGDTGLHVTWLDRAGRVTGESDVPDLAPATASPLYVTAPAAGGLAVLGHRGYGDDGMRWREVCVLVEVDGRGHELRRRDLSHGPGDTGCRPAGVVAVGGDVIVAVTTERAMPALGLTTDPPELPIGVVARLAPDGAVRWHRELAVDSSSVGLADLARGRDTIMVVGLIEQGWSEEDFDGGFEVGFGPTPLSLSGAEDPEDSRERVFALGLDPVTGTSRWLEIMIGHDETAFSADQLYASGAGGGLALAIQPWNTGRVDSIPADHGDVIVMSFDEATGARRFTQAIADDPRGEAPGIEVGRVAVDADGGIYLAGGFRRHLTIASASLTGRFVVHDPCAARRGARRGGGSPLFANPPPDSPDRCRLSFDEPRIAFVARAPH